MLKTKIPARDIFHNVLREIDFDLLKNKVKKA